ncbi:nuclear transport factor 2 family protein [Frigidibacter oleivorans]|uniref:nuclear transport factor 2 family protein n=1 Tax=Frigidibacter oleivorans TaxID=2487129 RepID=UPI00197A8EFC|nr:nuclear transport factor 2 family protein [Frigidibacter oleivorans]
MTRSIRNGAMRSVQLAGAFAILAIPALATPALADPSGVAARNEAAVREAFDRWAAGGSVFDPLLAPDVRWTIYGSGPVAGTYESRDSFVQDASLPLVSRLSAPVVPEVHAIWAVDDTVIVRFDGAATTTSGDAYENQFLWIFRMADGEVVEAEAFLDLAAYQQVVENNEPVTE